MPGADGYPVHQQLAQLLDHRGGVVFGTRRGAGVHDHDVVALEGLGHAVADQLVVVHGWRERSRDAAPLVNLRR